MDATHMLLAQSLALAGLVGATIEYCEIIKRRTGTRNLERASQESGLQGLVRVFLTEP